MTTDKEHREYKDRQAADMAKLRLLLAPILIAPVQQSEKSLTSKVQCGHCVFFEYVSISALGHCRVHVPETGVLGNVGSDWRECDKYSFNPCGEIREFSSLPVVKCKNCIHFSRLTGFKNAGHCLAGEREPPMCLWDTDNRCCPQFKKNLHESEHSIKADKSSIKAA